MDRVQKKDKAENAYLAKCGFNLVRLSEEEIKSGKFKERLVQ
jgi:very-short-patch-repair endonuclease